VVIPELKGKMDGISLRVPVGTGSVVDLVCLLQKKTTAEEVNKAFEAAANGRMKGFLEVTNDPIVSSDIKGYPVSSVVDARETKVLGDNLVKVLSWYDNEWAYSCRLGDLVGIIAKKLG
jgi:glyceraldehyde 3-phosphate dehydrogenase